MAIVFEHCFGQALRVRRWRYDGLERAWPAAGHAAFELATVDAGLIRYQLGSTCIEVRPGEVVAVPVQVEHRTTLTPGTRARSLWIGEGLMAELGDTLGRRLAPEPGLVRPTTRLLPLLELLTTEAEAEPHAPGTTIACEGLLDALLVQLYRGRAEEPAVGKDAAVLAAVERIERDYATPLSLADLAASARVSRFELSRRFKRATGTSPYQYLLRVRCRRAAELLRGGRVGVTDAALSVGFSDLGRFSRAFRRELGCSPTELRREARARAPALRVATATSA